MSKIKRLFLLVLISVILTTYFACSKSGSAVDFTFFNTVIHVETHDFAISNQTKTNLRELFSSLDKEFDCNDNQSSVYQINNADKNTPVTVSARFVDVLSLSKDYHSFTHKKFNPAIYPLVKLWQFDDYPSNNFTVPEPDEISSLLGEKIDFDKLLLDQTALTVQKLNDFVKVDFGGILKGYAVDKAFEILTNAGHKSGYINVGGSSLYLLSVEKLGVRHPRATEELSTILEIDCSSLNNVAVSTSGDYEKFYTVGDIKYNHIIDSSTGKPTDTGVVSATVIGGSGAFGDAVTTALCLANHEFNSKNSELVSLINKILVKYPSAMVFAVYDKGGNKELITNKKQGEHFTLLDSSYSINQI